MSFGLGFGSPFGGDIVSVGEPVSDVGGEPVTFDFTDEPNGPLPGSWQFYRIQTTPSSTVIFQEEPKPDDFYKIEGGLAWWKYIKQPATGAPFRERGVAGSPLGIVQGRNYEVAIAFVSPTELQKGEADEFFMEVLVGLHFSDPRDSFVGARVIAHWQSGSGWTTPVLFELVSFAGTDPITVLEAATFDPDIRLTDLWRVGELSEVRARVVGGVLTGILSGSQAEITTGVVPNGSSTPLILMRCFNRFGTVFDSPPAIAGVQLITLRDIERLGPAPSIEGHEQLWAPLWTDTLRIRVRELESEGFIKQTAGRVFEVVRAFETNEGGVKSTWNVGNRMRVNEPVQNQFLMPVVRDLAHIRGVNEKKGQA